MVGFGKRMADTQVPEWSTEYVPYKVMKKHLKRLVQRMTAEERQMTERGNLASSNGSNDGTRQQLLDGTADAGVRPQLKREVKSDREGLITVRTTSTDAFNHDDHADKARNRHRRQPSSETNELRIATTVVAPKDENVLALEEEVQFFHLLDEALRRVVSFYSDRLDHIRGEAQRERSQLNHLTSEAQRVVRMPKRKSKSDLADIMHDFGNSFTSTRHKKRSADPRSFAQEKARDDARMLRKAVSESYRAVNMLESFVSLNVEAFRKICKKHDKVTGWQTQDTYMRGLRELRVFHDDEVNTLRAALEDAYLKIEEVLCLLEPDRWNRVARGVKANRKSSKPSGPLGFYEVRKRRNELLAKLRGETRETGTSFVTRGRHSGPRFTAGLALGAAAALFGMLIAKIAESCADGKMHSVECNAVAAVAPAIRAPLLVALHVALYGSAVQAWVDTRVNAPFIMQAKRGTELTSTGAVLAGALIASTWLVISLVLVSRAENDARSASASIGSSPSVESIRLYHLHDVFAAAAGAMALMLLFFLAPWPKWALRGPFKGPFKTLQHPPNSTRRFFLTALTRAVQAPFRRVRMMDFFLADQLVSQTTAMRDALSVFFLAFGSAMRGAVRYAPVIAMWPSWCRLTQVLRRYRDDGMPVHLVNGGKYFTGLLAVAVGLILRYEEAGDDEIGGAIFSNPTRTRVWYNIATYTAVLYGAAWDYFQDWSVVKIKFTTEDSPGCGFTVGFFERKLMVKRKWIYHVAIAGNALLRNVWIIASVGSAIGGVETVGDEVWLSLWATTEVIRRSAWNYFRVENEHATNCGMFRATLDVPMPYDEGELTDEEGEEDDTSVKSDDDDAHELESDRSDTDEDGEDENENLSVHGPKVLVDDRSAAAPCADEPLSRRESVDLATRSRRVSLISTDIELPTESVDPSQNSVPGTPRRISVDVAPKSLTPQKSLGLEAIARLTSGMPVSDDASPAAGTPSSVARSFDVEFRSAPSPEKKDDSKT